MAVLVKRYTLRDGRTVPCEMSLNYLGRKDENMKKFLAALLAASLLSAMIPLTAQAAGSSTPSVGDIQLQDDTSVEDNPDITEPPGDTAPLR